MSEVVKVSVGDLVIGLHVSSLDRPWLETPFLLQGFYIRSEEEILQLQEYCSYVYVDVSRSQAMMTSANQGRNKNRKALLGGRKHTEYRDDSRWREEYPRAKLALKSLSSSIENVFTKATTGYALDIAKMRDAIEPMIESVTRNPDACLWLARMKQEGSYIYKHSLGSSIWAVALGRQLGMPANDLRSLALGGVLFDVGKLSLDRDMINANRKLTPEEFERVKCHVELGAKMVVDSGIKNKDVIDMVAYHHERYNGSGYPHGLKGAEIPVFARIAGLVDCYDAMTSNRPYAKGISPSAAIKELYGWRKTYFQSELVEEFIQAIGIYPAGSLVLLSTGEVAVVVSEYRTRRLRPKVMVLLDKNKQALQEMKTIDLLNEKETEAGEPLDIVRSLEPDAYGIDMMSIEL